MKKLYKFDFNCGRMGSLEGLFISTDKEVKSILGKDIYFGEALGKHSEIYGPIDKEDITAFKDVPSAVIEWLETNIGTTVSGYNPFDYWEEE